MIKSNASLISSLVAEIASRHHVQVRHSSEAAAQIRGIALPVDGGWTAQ